jgi:outer membrane protein OmpA-like peptidoglycan-associated protein
LKEVAAALQKNAWVKKVRVEGHTDDRGKDEANLELSQRRADSVMRFLVGAGIDPARLEARGLGETQPLVPSKTAADRAKNRRVAFVIVDPPQAPR